MSVKVRHDSGEVTIHATREDAIAAALIDMPDGDELAVHEGGCAMNRTGKCDCEPYVTVVRRGAA